MLVVSHEFGHFIVAKKNGIRVDEFAFGMGPKLFSWRKGETLYRVNAFPIGGYVKIFGENPDEESTNGPDKNRSFVHKSAWVQAGVLFAGVAMNFLVAWLLFSVSFMSGMPTSISAAPKGTVITNTQVAITGVFKDSPAEIAGLVAGDRIVHVSSLADSTEVPSLESLKYFVKKHSVDDIVIEFERNKELKQTHLTPKDGLIGINMDMIGTLKLPIGKAIFEGLKLTGSISVATVVGFYDLISNAIVGQGSFSGLSGPVGIVGQVGGALQFGFVYLLSFTALISINLAVINLIPFPALDGGRLLFLLIEKVKGSRINTTVANTVNMVGFVLLMLLMVIITYKDIVKLI